MYYDFNFNKDADFENSIAEDLFYFHNIKLGKLNLIGSHFDKANFLRLHNNSNSSNIVLTKENIANKDTGADITLSNVYFGYTGLKNTTVNVGKQGLTTPWTVAVDSDNNEQNGTGILALSTVGPVTLAGAFFNQTNLDDSGEARTIFNQGARASGDQDIATVGAIVAAGPATLDAWYIDANDLFDSYTIGAKAAFDPSPPMDQ